ncbi:hypothetical protein BDW42DRAFT_169524, partial [Aspergillus taichungensis]
MVVVLTLYVLQIFANSSMSPDLWKSDKYDRPMSVDLPILLPYSFCFESSCLTTIYYFFIVIL